MSYDVSVIIPCHNAEDTVERCINSVINQTFDFNNIELIIFEDASTDNTRQIISKYCDEYENIVGIFQDDNVGPGTGRNKSIQVASSDYLMFLDSDDEYCEDICQTLLDTIKSENADIVSCNFYNVDSFREYEEHYNCESNNSLVKGSMRIYDEYYSSLFGDILVWNKIFKKSLIIDNNIKFPVDYEDWIFSTKSFLCCKKLVYLKDYFGIKKYVYEGSLSHKSSENSCISFIDLLFEVDKLLLDNGYDIDSIKKFKLNDIKYNIITGMIFLSDASWKDNFITSFNRLCSYEEHVSFDESLGSPIFDFINRFVLNHNIQVSFVILKLMRFFKNFNFLRIIYNYIRTS